MLHRFAFQRHMLGVALLLGCSAGSSALDLHIVPRASAQEGTSVTVTRDSLRASVTTFLEAMRSRSASSLLASDARITENARVIALADSLLSGTRSYTYQAFFAEPSAAQAGLFGVADVGDSPLVFSVRLRVAGDKLTEVELLTARPGEASVAAPTALVKPDAMYESIVAPAERSTRADAIAIANKYFDGIERASGADVPLGDACNRFENGVQTTNNPAGASPITSVGCREGIALLSYIKKVRERRFVVDEERGLVWALVAFDMPGGPYRAVVNGQVIERDRAPNTLLLSEVFKIANGKIQRIEAVMRNSPLGTSPAWPVP